MRYSNPTVGKVARNILRKADDVKSNVSKAVNTYKTMDNAVKKASLVDYATAPAKLVKYAKDKVSEKLHNEATKETLNEGSTLRIHRKLKDISKGIGRAKWRKAIENRKQN